MTNAEIISYVSTLSDEAFQNYYAEKLVQAGYGQTTGGYYKNAAKMKVEKITQKWNFMVAYPTLKNFQMDGFPTWNNLKCPELLLWIAELCGAPAWRLKFADKYIRDFEEKYELKESSKDGKYFYKGLEQLKEILAMKEIQRIASEKTSMEEIRSEVFQSL